MNISLYFLSKSYQMGIYLLPNRRGLGALIALVGSHYLYQHYLNRININLCLEICFLPYPHSLFFVTPGLLTSVFSSTPSPLAYESHGHPAFVLCFYKLLSYSGVGLRFPGFSFPRLTAEGPTGQED